jgi:hypothetical protein
MMKKIETEQVEIPFKDDKGELAIYLDKIRKRIKFNDYDCFIVMCGKERRGKSTLAAQIGDYISEYKLTNDQICEDINSFLDALKNAHKGDVIIFDEAGTNLFSREAMTSMNRILVKAFMISGLKNVCIILCIPSFFLLDSYIRNHRVDLLFHIPKRGKFKVYSARRAKLISILGSKTKSMNVTKANLKGWFLKQYPERLEKEFRIKERKFKFGYLKDVKRDMEGYYKLYKFAEITGLAVTQIYDLIKRKKIVAKKIGHRWFIPKAEAEKITQELKQGLKESRSYSKNWKEAKHMV